MYALAHGQPAIVIWYDPDPTSTIIEDSMPPFGQLAPMGTGGFDVALDIDMLKDATINYQLPVQNMPAAHADGGITPGQVAMTPYDTNSPAWSEQLQGRIHSVLSARSQRWR